MGDEGKGTKKKGRLKKWILGIGGFLVFLMIVSSCGDDSESESVDVESDGATKVVQQYCEKIKKYDLDGSEKYVASSSGYYVNLNENVLNVFRDDFEKNTSKLEYEIVNEELDIDEDNMDFDTVTVKFTYIDESKIVDQVTDELLNEEISEDASDSEIMKIMKNKYKEVKKEFQEEKDEVEVKFVCIRNSSKSNPQWYINNIPEEMSRIITCNTEKCFEKFKTDVSDDAEENKSEGAYFEVGDTVEYASGLCMKIMDTGVYTSAYGDGYVYITLEIENKGADEIYFYPTSFNFYGDDYCMDTGIAVNDDEISVQTLDPGRKANGRIYAECNNYNSVNNIEVQYGDAVFKIK